MHGATALKEATKQVAPALQTNDQREMLNSFRKRHKPKKAAVATTVLVRGRIIPIEWQHCCNTNQEETDGAKQFALLPQAEQTDRLRVLAARFSCAVAELQLVGVCRQSKQRRRGTSVQRTVYLPAVLVCG